MFTGFMFTQIILDLFSVTIVTIFGGCGLNIYRFRFNFKIFALIINAAVVYVSLIASSFLMPF